MYIISSNSVSIRTVKGEEAGAECLVIWSAERILARQAKEVDMVPHKHDVAHLVVWVDPVETNKSLKLSYDRYRR